MLLNRFEWDLRDWEGESDTAQYLDFLHCQETCFFGMRKQKLRLGAPFMDHGSEYTGSICVGRLLCCQLAHAKLQCSGDYSEVTLPHCEVDLASLKIQVWEKSFCGPFS